MKRVVAALFVSVTILVACNPGAPDFLGTQNPPPSPVIDSLPYKIVEIDKYNDSSVTYLAYTPAGNIATIEVKTYIFGVVDEAYNSSFTYYADGKLQSGVMRWANSVTKERTDYYCPKNAAGQVIGLRTIDSSRVSVPGGRAVYYFRYAFDNKNRLSKVYYNIDSADFFAAAPPVNSSYVESMIYDSHDRITEYYLLCFYSSASGGDDTYRIVDKALYSDFDNGKSFIKAGLNAYIILDAAPVLGGVAKTINEEHRGADGSLLSSASSDISITYDAANRPVVINMTNNPSNFYPWSTGLFIPDVNQRKLYYR